MNSNFPAFIFIIGTLSLMLFAFTLVTFLVIHKKRRFQHLFEKQQLESTYQNQLLQSRLEVQEQSFRYFSEEIHDNIGQLLSLVKMQLYNIRNNSREPETVDKAQECNELLGKAINGLRNISHTLNSAYINNVGLTDAIEKELTYIRSAKEIQCILHVSGEEYSLGSERELLVFRIIQEAISNSMKHASPTMVDIYIHYKPLGLTITIKDNGFGFDTKGRPMTGIGLNNMYVRASLLKADLQIMSEINSGTAIQLSIADPLPPSSC